MERESEKKKLSKQPSAPPSLNRGKQKEEGKDGSKDASNTDINANKANVKVAQNNKNGSKQSNNESNVKIFGKFTTIRVKTKSVEDKLDKLCLSNNGGQAATPTQNRSSKSIFSGHNFCMDPEQMAIRLNLLPSNKNDDPEKTFLGIPITRQNPQMRLVTLNKLLQCLDSTPTPSLCAQKTSPFLAHEASVMERVHKNVSKYMGYLKASICGEKVLNDKELIILTQTIVKVGFISTLVMKMPLLGFEDRKTASLVWCNLLRRPASEPRIVAYIEANPKLLLCLLDGYHNQSLALTTGTMLRECFRYEGLAKAIFYSEYFYEIFEFFKTATFDVSTDAFLTLQSLLLQNGPMSEEYLLENFDKFFFYFDELVNRKNFVTQLCSLKFLGIILLDRRFYDVMQRYILDSDRVKRLILLMSSGSKILQLEGFHVLKVFIANPTPPPKMHAIFVRNKEKLLRMIDTIDGGEACGENFPEEKAFVVKRLKEIGRKESDEGSDSISGYVSDSNSNDDLTEQQEL